MKDIGIIEYGMGNIDSVRRAFEQCGAKVTVRSEPHDLTSHDALILPGVGSFSTGVKNLAARGHIEALHDAVLNAKTPILGICLGMQLMATRGEEHGISSGLDWIPGEVVRMKPGPGERVPHVGWNDVVSNVASPLLPQIDRPPVYYFVHSYQFRTAAEEHCLATTPYAGGLAAVVAKENVAGVQFHPEKSQKIGMMFIRNFLELV